MYTDIGNISLHINRYYLNNWAIGLDYYQLNDAMTERLQASVLQVSILFFNITFTRWHKWIA